MSKIKINEELIGKRVLWKRWWGHYFYVLNEGVVEEMSPSKKYVKIGGNWHTINNIEVLEILENKKEEE